MNAEIRCLFDVADVMACLDFRALGAQVNIRYRSIRLAISRRYSTGPMKESGSCSM